MATERTVFFHRINHCPYLLMIFPPGLYLDAARDIHGLGFYRFQGRKEYSVTEPPGEDEGVAGRRFARQVPVAGLPRAAETDRVMGIDEKGPHRVIDHRGKLFFAPEGQGLDQPFAREAPAIFRRLSAMELDESSPQSSAICRTSEAARFTKTPTVHRPGGSDPMISRARPGVA